jgi:hypothetical protein
MNIFRSNKFLAGSLILFVLSAGLLALLWFTPAFRAKYTTSGTLGKQATTTQQTDVTQPDRVDTANWTAYRDANTRISFKHPANWRVTGTITDPNLQIYPGRATFLYALEVMEDAKFSTNLARLLRACSVSAFQPTAKDGLLAWISTSGLYEERIHGGEGDYISAIYPYDVGERFEAARVASGGANAASNEAHFYSLPTAVLRIKYFTSVEGEADIQDRAKTCSAIAATVTPM